MKARFFLVVFLVAAAAACASAAVKDEENALILQLQRKRAAEKRVIIDITHPYVPRGMPNYGSPRGLPPFAVPHSNITKGDVFNTVDFTLNTHWGTHVDAPGHINNTLLHHHYDVNHLNLTTLNGPCWVVDTPRDQNITAKVMKELNIPQGVTRVLFRTLNTDNRLMNQSGYDANYTAFTTDGARYLVSNTDIKLVGVDYLSVAVSDEVRDVHLTLLDTKVIIVAEGLKLDHVAPGTRYTVRCRPLRLPKFDGSPARCLLFADQPAAASSAAPPMSPPAP